jgi:hypothetical protein
MRRRISSVAVLLPALAAAVVPPAAARAATFSASFAPSVLHGPPPWIVSASLRMEAGPADEHLELALLDGGVSVQGPAHVTRVSRALDDEVYSRFAYSASGCDLHFRVQAPR